MVRASRGSQGTITVGQLFQTLAHRILDLRRFECRRLESAACGVKPLKLLFR